MRITCVIHSLNGGGAERVMAGLASRLAERDHAVTLITLGDGASRHELTAPVQSIALDVMTRPGHRVSTWKRGLKLRHALCESEPDVVLSFCDQMNVLTLAVTRFAFGVPVIVCERSDPRRQTMGTVKEWLRRRLYRHAARVVCLTEEVASYLRLKTNCLADVIPSAVQVPSDYRPVSTPANPANPANLATPATPATPANPAEPLKLLAAGRLEFEKGFDRLLKACSILPPGLSWHLTLLGEGSRRDELQHQAERLNLRDQISMPGWQPIWPALAKADLFVLPSRYEGFPSAMLEAMAAGVAVLATNIGGGVDAAIEHGKNGWIVDSHPRALAEGLHHLAGDCLLRRRLAKSATKVNTQFGWTAMVDRYERLLRDVVAR